MPAKDDVNKRTVFYAPASFPRGDMTMEQICEKLAGVLGIPVPTEQTGMLSPLKQLRLQAKEGLFAEYTKDKKSGKVQMTFSGGEIPYAILVQFDQLLEELQPHFPKGLYFLDEFNRAEDDTLQASFELVLDKKVGQNVLPRGWQPVAAGNFTDGYSVNPFVSDPALMDRFCHLTLSGGEETLDDWAQWMAGEFGAQAQQIIEFGMQNTKHVYGDVNAKDETTIAPTPRSWAMVASVEKACSEGAYDDNTRRFVISGLVGAGLAIGYMNYTCPVPPKQLAERGVDAFKAPLLKITKDPHARGILGGLMFGVLSFVTNRLDEDKIIDNCLDFTQFLVERAGQNDLAVAFLSQCMGGAGNDDISEDQKQARAALMSNTKLLALVAKWKPADGGKLRIVDKLNKRPKLKELMSNVSWGYEAD